MRKTDCEPILLSIFYDIITVEIIYLTINNTAV